MCIKTDGIRLFKTVPLSATKLDCVRHGNHVKQHNTALTSQLTSHSFLLSVSDNQLTALPAEIGNLTNLTQLYRV